MNPAAELSSGHLKPLSMMQGIGPDVDAVFLIGYHAASGTGAAILEHTSTGLNVRVQLNGQEVGELGFNAAVAGAYDVPVLLVSGDRAVTEEARALLGEIETAAVKDGISRNAAQCLHPEIAQERIRKAAERALQLKVSPFVVSPPVTLRVVFQRASHADEAALLPPRGWVHPRVGRQRHARRIPGVQCHDLPLAARHADRSSVGSRSPGIRSGDRPAPSRTHAACA